MQEEDVKIRRNFYKLKEKKPFLPSKNLSPVKKPKITENKPLQAFYRYYLVSLLTLLNRKEDYLNFLKGKKLDLMANPLKINEIEEKLLKQLESKGKDKGRQKFSHMTNEQLRSLKYKSRISSNHPSSLSPKK